jgi:hypothetical protein
MLFLGSRINQNIVNEHKVELVQILDKNVVHQTHKGGWCIGKPKRHHDKLIVSTSPYKSCFMDIFILNCNMMVSIPQVYFRKYCSSFKLIKKIINSRKWVFIIDGNNI